MKISDLVVGQTYWFANTMDYVSSKYRVEKMEFQRRRDYVKNADWDPEDVSEFYFVGFQYALTQDEVECSLFNTEKEANAAITDRLGISYQSLIRKATNEKALLKHWQSKTNYHNFSCGNCGKDECFICDDPEFKR
jgi:hypothetical protein